MRNTGPKCRLCRSEGVKLFLKGKRCFSAKCPIERKGAVPPGMHGAKRQRKPSDYGIQLREKQKTKRLYGISEKQMSSFYQKAAKEKGPTGEILLRQLEMRLDNVVYRGGLVGSRSIARQLVSHGRVTVKGKRVNIPSYKVAIGEIISLDSKGLKMAVVKKSLAAKNTLPKWLKREGAAVRIERLPQRKEMELIVDERLIVEHYSR